MMRDVETPAIDETSGAMTGHPTDLDPPAIPGISALVRIPSGGFCPIYRGRQTRTGRGVAVKVLPIPFDRNTRAQFDYERVRIGRLRHVQAILQVDDVDVLIDGRTYLVSELCTESIADSIQRGDRLSEQQVVSLGHELAGALGFAHEAAVVHGSITPCNVLFRRSGHAVLSDFGLALRQTYPGDSAEGGEYAAPETLRDGSATARSDLYGLGATLYAALTGRPPFPARIGEHPSERILRVISQNAPAVDSSMVSPAVAMLLAELLATLPEDRPGDATAVAERFAAIGVSLAAPKNSRKKGAKSEAPLAEAPTSDVPEADVPEADVPKSDVPVADAPEIAPEPDESRNALGPDESTATEVTELPDPRPEAVERLVQASAPEGSTDWSGLLDDVLFDTEPADDIERSAMAGMPAGLAHPAGRRRRPGSLLVAVVAGALLVVGLSVLAGRLSGEHPAAQNDSPPAAPSSATPAPGGRSPVPAVRLVAARDRGATVDLTWSGSPRLNYAVVVAEPGHATQVVLAHHARRFRVRVVPGRQYCFLVQATNGEHIVETEPRAIRGAVCKT